MNEVKNPKVRKPLIYYYMMALLIMLLLNTFLFPALLGRKEVEVDYSTFTTQLAQGNIQQVGTPVDIYNEPKNAFVADFIGESNIIDGVMHADGVVGMYGKKFSCLDKGFAKDEPVDVVIRPEDIKVVSPERAPITGVVESVIFKGVHFEMIVDAHGYKWMIHSTRSEQPGTFIGMEVDPFDIHIMHKMEVEG